MDNPTNPLRLARTNLGITQASLARSLGLSPLTILRSEQGLFSAPPQALTEFLQVEPTEYYRWVYHQRVINGDHPVVLRALIYLDANQHLSPRSITTQHLAKNIMGLSTAGFAKLLVLQISLVQEFFKRGRNLDTVGNILLQWGFPMVQLEDFKEWVHAY